MSQTALMPKVGDTFLSNWENCSPVRIIDISIWKNVTLIKHTRTLHTGFEHTWETNLEVFLQDIQDGALVPMGDSALPQNG